MKEAALENVFKGRLQKQSLKKYGQSTFIISSQENDYLEKGSFKASSALLHKRFHLHFKKGPERIPCNEATLHKAFSAFPRQSGPSYFKWYCFSPCPCP